jgi:hypothetical protein
MPDALGKPLHIGPEPRNGAGPQAVHTQIHERAVGKTIAQVYLGDCEPLPDLPQSEYVVFEFTDGSTLMLEVAGGYSFSVSGDKEGQKVLARARSGTRHHYH